MKYALHRTIIKIKHLLTSARIIEHELSRALVAMKHLLPKVRIKIMYEFLR